MPNSLTVIIQIGGGRHTELSKNVNISGWNEDICTTFGEKMCHGHTSMAAWSKKWNNKYNTSVYEVLHSPL